MDTKPLERFATWARRELINAVDAQATAVLAVGSVARSERAGVIKKLEAEIARHGRQQVVDRVAYIWFNRIIALRFMDARGYTDAGIVSPAQGQTHGQPEILSDAKRGNLDTAVVASARTAEAIIGLLDGTRRSTDAEGEAYALLLTEYCRYWHKPMPFMFEREGDYTELLVPANLLADGAILSLACEVLTEDVCDDVEVIGWLYQFYISERKAEVFAGFKATGKARTLAGPDEIPAATQLFTPHWIVRYLVENSLGRLWMLNRPTSRLVDQMDYYIAPVDDESDFLKVSRPQELTMIDPACGSGHMLTYAFDLLYAIYEEEGYAPSDIPGLILTHNLHGTEIDPRAGALAAFALTMKARAKLRIFFTRQVKPNICVIEPISFTPEELDFLVSRGGDRHDEETLWNQFTEADTLGSLLQPDPVLTTRLAQHLESLEDTVDILRGDVIARANRVLGQAKYLTSRYSVAVANPPYMGSKNMAAQLVAFSQDSYPDSKADLFAMFIERCRSLVCSQGGLVAMITMHSWMFLASFGKLRTKILRGAPPATMAHLGERAFDSIGGSVVSTTAFVLQEGRGPAEGVYLRLTDGKNETEKAAFARAAIAGRNDHRLYRVQPLSFVSLPGAPLAYWFPSALLESFATAPLLDATARTAIGMITGSNAAFVREWWEVSRTRLNLAADSRERAASSGRKWFPYAKGGEFRRWGGNAGSVVNWELDGYELQTTTTDDGKRIRGHNFNLERIFKPGIVWTVVTTNGPSFRRVEAGSLFDAAAGICQSTDDVYTLALLNSSSVTQVLAGLNPTMNLHPGYLGAVPAPVDLQRDPTRAGAARAVELSQEDWNVQERSWDFGSSPLVGRGPSLPSAIDDAQDTWSSGVAELHEIEQQNDLHFAKLFGFDGEVEMVPINRVSLTMNPSFTYRGVPSTEARDAQRDDAVRDLVSFAVGCMFGRYSLDAPGLILADQGATLQDYLAKVSTPSFTPDVDNVIPLVDDGWFEDDIVERFRQFLRAAFGAENFEENLRFVEEALGVKTLRDYFISKAGKSKFYDDHVQRYKKRPIYWMFSSPKGSFNALIYMHRYTSSTVSTVLNEYLREYRAKLEVALANSEQAAAGGSAKDQKEADRLRKVLVELAEYEHDVLYPLATEQVAIDLDDGVKANYPRFYPALKKITGLEAVE
jgi:hypothetical protein